MRISVESDYTILYYLFYWHTNYFSPVYIYIYNYILYYYFDDDIGSFYLDDNILCISITVFSSCPGSSSVFSKVVGV